MAGAERRRTCGATHVVFVSWKRKGKWNRVCCLVVGKTAVVNGILEVGISVASDVESNFK
jgi:hypothetical protein